MPDLKLRPFRNVATAVICCCCASMLVLRLVGCLGGGSGYVEQVRAGIRDGGAQKVGEGHEKTAAVAAIALPWAALDDMHHQALRSLRQLTGNTQTVHAASPMGE
eukprot:GHVT01105079.1.p2 GENE.GHVT01105079.1~~GHVT01105079.1.p2  ORF type:complete len:105 (+),score=19.35 GHVT01105079.1:1560-1874(+)